MKQKSVLEKLRENQMEIREARKEMQLGFQRPQSVHAAEHWKTTEEKPRISDLLSLHEYVGFRVDGTIPKGDLYGPPSKEDLGVCAIYSETTVLTFHPIMLNWICLGGPKLSESAAGRTLAAPAGWFKEVLNLLFSAIGQVS